MIPNQKRILILFAHPAFEKSRVNKYLVEAVRHMEEVTFHDLYEQYPDFHIDVEREQELLETHDVIIFHHPFFWYSTPAMLKEWQDLVLEHGWAYGSQGKALQGKLFMNLVTTGGPEIAYHAEGRNHFTVRQLLAPIEQTANLCRMIYLAPFIVHGTHAILPEQIEKYAGDYRDLISALAGDRINIDAARKATRINDPAENLIYHIETQ